MLICENVSSNGPRNSESATQTVPPESMVTCLLHTHPHDQSGSEGLFWPVALLACDFTQSGVRMLLHQASLLWGHR